MLSGWWARLRRHTAPVSRIGDAEWMALVADSPLFGSMAPMQLERLRGLAETFLARKRFSAAAGHELQPDHCLAIAALACLPVLDLGPDWLSGWREVIVYPGEFRVRREHHDEATGVVTEMEDDLIGEAWERGPLILSWADIATDLAHPFDGFNVVVHEIAHKLDLLDGAMNGTPRLPHGLSLNEWIAAMQPAYDALVRAVERGRPTLIDPYASESVEEFFAVVSELHFSDPRTLEREAPAVAGVLARLYGPAVARPGVAAQGGDG